MALTEVDKLVIDLKKNNFSVYSTILNGNVYLWRPLTRFEREVAQISANGDELLYEDLVCHYAVLYPKDIDFSDYHLGGVPSILAPQIIKETGFDDTDKFLSEMSLRQQNILTNYVAQLETIIVTAFPQYKFEEMREWNLEQICDMAARAEYAIVNIHGQREFKILDIESVENNGTDSEMSDDEMLRQKEEELVEAGQDPIMILGPYYQERKMRPYCDVPFIMGTEYDNEVLLDGIGQQLRTRQSNGSKQE